MESTSDYLTHREIHRTVVPKKRIYAVFDDVYREIIV